MSFCIINQLREATPNNRPAILNDIYQRNINYFNNKHPSLLKFLENTRSPFHIDITETFLNIIDERSGQLAHPEAGLDLFAEMLGDWTHEAWIDLFNFQIPIMKRYPKHCKIVEDFSNNLQEAFPQLSERLSGGRINLKHIDIDKRFSPPVVFLGIFHGLHIASYLERTDLTTALFIEPEPIRFEVSCYFLDYSEIEKKFGTLYLAIGEDTTASSIESFFSLLRVTPLMWTRILCGYPFEKAHFFIESIKSLQATNTNLLYPLDNEIDSLIHGAINLHQNLPILTTRPRVSKQCKIAVVATGPSLENDLDWLKENQQNLIIFAVHSSVKILRKHGIKPDFQLNLDAIIKYNFKQSLELFSDVPFVTDYKAPPHIIAEFDTPLLCADTHKNSSVHFHTSLTETHPSTTNLAFSFACFLKPATIYLIGCDCGYRTLKQDHARGSFYEEILTEGKPHNYAANALQSLIAPNFSDTEPIQTISQHLRTKIVIERCIATNATGISVFNLSDGAFIVGATPHRSQDIILKKYQKKQNDIRKIVGSFEQSKKNRNWKPYTKSGNEKLQKLKIDIIEIITTDTFSWYNFSKSIDTALIKIITNDYKDSNDTRMNCYYRVIGDLLCLWYRNIIILDDIKEAENMYMIGLNLLKKSLEQLDWPFYLDELQYKTLYMQLPPAWKIYLAHLYGTQNNFINAMELVTSAYDENPVLKNAFAQLGWMLTKTRQWEKALEIAIEDERRNRLSPIWQVHVAQLYGRINKFDHAAELIETAYANDTNLKDGFTRLGWILTEKRNWPKAFEFAVQDENRKRLSPKWKVNVAQLHGRMRRFEHATELIATAYAADANLKDAFARLGWIKMETKEWNSAYELMAQDYAQGRISPAWMVFLAIVAGCLQRWPEAMALVAESYTQDATLCDGYSRLGWWGYLLGKGEDFFLEQLNTDRILGQHRVKNLLFEALHLTVAKQHNNALMLVQQAYRNDKQLENWQTIIGWLHIRLGNVEFGLKMMTNDYSQGRMSCVWLASYAVALGICGQKIQAMNILHEISTLNTDILFSIGFYGVAEAWMTKSELQTFIASSLAYDDLNTFSDPNRYPSA